MSELQASLAQANAVLASRNAQFSELTILLDDNTRTRDNLSRRIVENQNQTNGAVISVPLDNELQAQKKALEELILVRVDQSRSIGTAITAITTTINNLKSKIEKVKNGETVSLEENSDLTPIMNSTRIKQSINAVYAGDPNFIFAKTTVPVDFIKANATSGLPVTRSVTKGSELVCSISGDTLTFNAEGNCRITISQSGDVKFDSAEAQISLLVLKNSKLSDSSAGANQNTNLPKNSDDPTLDGEEDPFAKINAKRSSNGIYTISVSSNIEDDDLVIRASKKGSKTIVYKIQTNENGTYSFKTSRILKGFKLTLYYLGDVLHDLRL